MNLGVLSHNRKRWKRSVMKKLCPVILYLLVDEQERTGKLFEARQYFLHSQFLTYYVISQHSKSPTVFGRNIDLGERWVGEGGGGGGGGDKFICQCALILQ